MKKLPRQTPGRQTADAFGATPAQTCRQTIMVLVAAAVAVLTAVTYRGAWSLGMTGYDDTLYVSENPAVHQLNMDTIAWAFTHVAQANYHPLTWMSHALDCQLFGVDNIRAFHGVNVALHCLNSALVVVLALQLLGWIRRRGSAVVPTRGQGSLADEASLVVPAFLAGMVFGIHPQHVESVAWLAERKDLLCGVFYLPCLLSYLAYVHRSQQGRQARLLYATVILLCLLALLSKPMAVSLPIVLLILDWYPFRRLGGTPHFRTMRRPLLEKLPLITLAAASCIATLYAQQHAMTSLQSRPLAARLLAVPSGYVFYLAKFFWPVNLAALYPLQSDATWRSPHFVWGACILSALLVVALVATRRAPAFVAALAAYLVMLAPVIGVVQVGVQSTADRYMYLPSVPVLLLLAATISRSCGLLLCTRRDARQGDAGCPGASSTTLWAITVVLLAGVISLALTLGHMTTRQIQVWRDGVTLWRTCLDRTGNAGNPTASHLYASALLNRGGEEDVAEADKLLKGLLQTKGLDRSLLAAVLNKLAGAYALRGELQSARKCAEQSLNLLEHREGQDRQERTNSLMVLSYVNLAEGRLEEAMDSCHKALGIAPGFAAAHYNLACALSRMNRLDEAVASLMTAMECGYLQGYDGRIESLLQDPDLENLRKDPRFKVLMQNVDLTHGQ